MEPFKSKNTILDAETVKETLASSITKPLTVQKKPVKFTWDGLANFILTTDVGNPLSFYNMKTLTKEGKDLPRITDLAKGKKRATEKDYIDFFEDMEKSIYGGAQNFVYSIGDLLTTGTDLAFDTNLTAALDKEQLQKYIE